MIVFSGQVPTKVIGNDAFQEADVTGITRPCTKWNYLVKNVRELPRVVNEAFLVATSGRPGPVLIDLAQRRAGRHLHPRKSTTSRASTFSNAKKPACPAAAKNKSWTPSS